MKTALIVLLGLVAVASAAVNVPFKDCGSSLAPISKIEASAWPPTAGATLTVTSYGNAKQAITGGTYQVQSYYIGIKVSDDKGDFCALTTCPLAAGDFTLSSTSTFPDNAPSGSYTLKMITKDAAGASLYCTSIDFSI